jgi:acyl-CoA synthetase (AMP-forming)/AMP-acid ligase II
MKNSFTTIPGLLAYQVKTHSNRLALSVQSHWGYRDRLTYAQLDFLGTRMGFALRALGIDKGDRIAVFLTNDAGREAVLTALGCFAIGAAVVPLNTRSSDEELRYAINSVEPTRIVTIASCAQRLHSLAPVRQLLIDAELTELVHDQPHDRWPEPLNAKPPSDSLPSPDPENLTCLLFTSGTTAHPKVVMHNHRTMLATGHAMGSALGIQDDDVYQGAFPFFTSSCLNLACMSTWVKGATFVMEHSLNTAQRLELIETERTSYYHGVPSILQFMLDEVTLHPRNLLHLKRVAYGGGAMPTKTIDRIAEQWHWTSQVQVWGMTESGPAGTYLPSEYTREKIGSIGLPMPNCEVAVVDDQFQKVPFGDVGELLFRGPSQALGYFRDPQATGLTFTDGWLRTGDLVKQDGDGFLYFLDRKKDVINRGGLKIASVAVESVIYKMAGVVEAAVIAVPHAVLGDDIAACVVLSPDSAITVEQLREFCLTRLADYEIPRQWFFLDALPKSPIGKILKRELRVQVLKR